MAQPGFKPIHLASQHSINALS